MSFLPPQTLFMKSELLRPPHMEPGYIRDGKWENFKPFPDFSCVFSPFTSWAPDWTGANISFTRGPCFPSLVFWRSEGLHASRHLRRSSVLGWNHSISKMFPTSKQERRESVIKNKRWLLFLPHALLSLLFCPMGQAGQGGYLYYTNRGIKYLVSSLGLNPLA